MAHQHTTPGTSDLYRVAARTQSTEIRAGRLASGLTQNQAADLVGVSKNSWCKYEYGTLQAPVDVREKLAELWRLDRGKLGLEPDRFCPACGEPFD